MIENPKIIVISDDEVKTQIQSILEGSDGGPINEGRIALRLSDESRTVAAALDLPLPSSSRSAQGVMNLGELLRSDPEIRVVVIGSNGAEQDGAEQNGAQATASSKATMDGFEEFIGRSPQLQNVLLTIGKVSATNAPVLVVGESGTGKELVARAIHKRSARSAGPFVAINCGAIPENLLESELFGHEKGAFTGAHARREGRFETAEGGTLFLDEIGELSAALQVKLLRFLQDHEIERVGGRTRIRIDTRVMAATNADLRQAMSEGRFREDLFYRLGVVVVTVPALRERDGDIPLLAQAFLDRQAVAKKKGLTFTAKAREAMSSYAWPGNVRELENRIHRAAIMAETGRITPEDLELDHVTERASFALCKAREAVDRRMVESALSRNNGNISRAAADLEISRPTLYELINKLGIVRG